jgi:23S rRNA pseudouridine1911/1915/1917 synthase
MIYKIEEDQAGARLDKFLVEKVKDKTRGDIQRLIESGEVLVNGKKKSNHYFLKAGESVEIKKEKAGSKKPKLNPDLKIDIVFENDDFLVVNKPAGLIVHGAPHIKEATLADWLLKKHPGLKKVGEDKLRPGIMHRLDKEASGLLVVAKNNPTFFCLKKQFQDRKIEKEYTALVYGAVLKEGGEINFPLKRAKTGHRQAAVPEGWDDIEDAGDLKEALTEFKIVKKYLNYTLLSVKIKSGRKHQIRAHFYAFGHPLVGDDLYSTRTTKVLNKKLPLGRIFLAAVKLGFVDTAGVKHEFSIDLPQELKDFLPLLK